ncbi:MAG: hypothetical protein ACI358_01145 [Candidatus Limimorpha sp.]
MSYQSVRTRHAQPTQTSPIPDEAKIAVAYTISEDGALTAIVFNRTSEIMTIDQTKSFFVNSNGKSTSYYDPTVKTTSTTDISSTTSGASVNLGAIAGALGIGGALGSIANGINVGGAGTNGTSTTNTTYIADQPEVSLAPYGNGAMSKTFYINGIGTKSLKSGSEMSVNLSEPQSYCRFSVCISYSVNNGETYDKIVTNFYANSKIIVPVVENGKLNEALNKVYSAKPDLLNEHWWMLYFNNNNYSNYNTRVQGIMYDYK